MSAVRVLTGAALTVLIMLFGMLTVAWLLFHTLGIPAWDGLAMTGCVVLLTVLIRSK